MNAEMRLTVTADETSVFTLSSIYYKTLWNWFVGFFFFSIVGELTIEFSTAKLVQLVKACCDKELKENK